MLISQLGAGTVSVLHRISTRLYDSQSVARVCSGPSIRNFWPSLMPLHGLQRGNQLKAFTKPMPTSYVGKPGPLANTWGGGWKEGVLGAGGEGPLPRDALLCLMTIMNR